MESALYRETMFLPNMVLVKMPDIEDNVLSHSLRGLDTVKQALPSGYGRRAAELIPANAGNVLIGTGFPVGGSFESEYRLPCG
jgi:hypothetical protein